MKNLYSVYDTQTRMYGTPWIAENDNTAKRAFERIAADPSTDIHFRPKDFELCHVGYFDEDSGAFESELNRITPTLNQ